MKTLKRSSKWADFKTAFVLLLKQYQKTQKLEYLSYFGRKGERTTKTFLFASFRTLSEQSTYWASK